MNFFTSCLALVVLLSFLLAPFLLLWFLGFVLYRFSPTRILGFRFMAWSGLYHDSLPSFCPCKDCDHSCKIWTCPNYRN